MRGGLGWDIAGRERSDAVILSLRPLLLGCVVCCCVELFWFVWCCLVLGYVMLYYVALGCVYGGLDCVGLFFVALGCVGLCCIMLN